MTDDTTRTGIGGERDRAEPVAMLQPLPTPSRAGAAGTLLLALLLGAVLGAGALAFGLDALPARAVPQSPALPASAYSTPGMDRLNGYRCDKAETKTIILGGREDGFVRDASDPDTLPRPGDLRTVVAEREGGNGAVGADRPYDDTGLDNMLLDRFALPRRTAHGIMVVRLDERSSKPNDTLGLGNIIDRIDIAHNWSSLISELGDAPGVTVRRDALPGKLVEIDLSAIDFPRRPTLQGGLNPQAHATLMSYIRTGEGETADLQFSVIDDTAVDFVGFALCEEPSEHRGFSLFVEPVETDPELLHMICRGPDGTNCDPNGGDMPCAAELPLACFRRGGVAVPQTLGVTASRSWSGGHIDFTEPVRGSSFESREQAQALCRARFGDDWRVADYHDGRTHRTIIARGTPDVSRAWVDARLQQYGSCWPRGEDYADVLDEPAQ